MTYKLFNYLKVNALFMVCIDADLELVEQISSIYNRQVIC